ncbi:Acetyltransferase (GNAT) family protein [Filomicrobium insigne]|nr:GNAT family N-acetyltransferase [Filomicrobium sp.]SDP49012.1 Acetyltransferase (GNAT) family protein [Filomicrobium insigne]
MHTQNSFHIKTAQTAMDLEAVATLFRAYAAALNIDLSYQNFEAELASLPGEYGPPAGCLLLARSLNGNAIGCVALRPLEFPACCEMKRLYVAPDARRSGLGHHLVNRILKGATKLGYREIRLDTLPKLSEAIALYGKAGFEVTEPYYDTPIAGTIFMRRPLP